MTRLGPRLVLCATAAGGLATAAMGVCMAVGLRNVWRSTAWMRPRATVPAGSESSYFYVIVPALREANVIASTLAWLRSLDYPSDKFEIIVAVRATETAADATVSVVENYLAQNPSAWPRVTVNTYEGRVRRRSAQLNSALRSILDRQRRPTREFVAVFDADSRPDRQIFQEVDAAAADHLEPLCAQSAVTYFGRPERYAQRPLVHASAVYQTLWNYIFELPRLINTYTRLRNGRRPLFPPYCMGHGEIFEVSALQVIGGFPAEGPCDGIQVGFALSRSGIPILPLRSADDCEQPESLRVLVRQHSFWFSGNLEFFRWYLGSPRRLPDHVGLLLHLVLNVKWLTRPFVVLAAAGFCFSAARWLGLAACATTVFGYYTAIRLRVRVIVGLRCRAHLDRYALLVPIAAAFKSLGSIRATARALLRLSNDNKVER